MGLPVAYALKMCLVLVVIQETAQIKTGVKIESVQYLKKLHIVMNVMKHVEKDC